MDIADHAEILSRYPPYGFAPTLAWAAVVLTGPKQDLGPSPQGHRFLVPILGGHFTGGPKHGTLSGKVLSGGADRQLLRGDGIKELSAIYEMQTDDGAILGIKNEVIVDTHAQPERYALSRIHVMAPDPGPWRELNRRLFLGTLHSSQPNPGHVVIRAWLMEVT